MVRVLLAVSVLVLGSSAFAEPFVWPSTWFDAAPEEARRGGTIRFWELGDPNTFNPFVSAGGGGLLPFTDWNNGALLLRRSPETGDWVPYAAESFEVSEDGRTVTLTLREELRWSDGTPITARDYLFRYEAEIDPAVQSIRYESWHVGDERIEMSIEGDHVIEFRFPVADRTAFDVISMNPSPEHILGDIYRSGGAEALRNAWGVQSDISETVWSSAFVPVGFTPGERIVLRRNEHFGTWNVDETGSPLPHLDGIEVAIVASADAAMNLFLAGELDVIGIDSLDDVGILARAVENGDLDAVVSVDAELPANAIPYFFNWNLASDPFRQRLFRSATFRRAMSHLVDRRAIIELVYGGSAEPMWSAVYRSMGDWVASDVPRFPYNPEAALELLASLGFDRRNDRGVLVDADGNELSFTLTTNSGAREREQIAQIIADTARDVGVDIQVQTVDFNLMADWVLTKGPERTFHAMIVGFGGAPRSWPFNADEWPCDALLHVWNASGECLSAQESLIEKLYDEGRRTLDLAEARAIAHEMQWWIADMQAQIFLPTPNWHVAYNATLDGLYLPRYIAEGWGYFEFATVFFAD